MKSNRVMSMNVLALAHTQHQAAVRSAGQEGVVLYELLVERDLARTHVKLETRSQHQGPAVIKHVPLWLGTQHQEVAISESDVLVVVASELDSFPRLVAFTILSAFHNVCLRGGFEDITVVPAGFLNKSTSLTAIDLTPLSNVTALGANFLERCSSLTALNLGPLSNVTEIQFGFLDGCSSLATIDLGPISKVTVLTGGFLEGCSSLTDIDLSPMSNVVDVRDDFLDGCTSMITTELAD